MTIRKIVGRSITDATITTADLSNIAPTITGGTIDGAAIGATTKSTVGATNITATGTLNVTGITTATGVINANGGIAGTLSGPVSSSSVTITGGSISGITDLAVADGGTGASDAATARTNLGLGTIATQAANSVSITGGSISGVTGVASTGANSFTGNQTGADNQLVQWTLKDQAYAVVDKGTQSTGTITFDYTVGSYQRLQVSGALSVVWSNWPPSGTLGEMIVELVNGAAATVTWPSINWIKSDGSFTTTFASNGVTLQSGGTDFVCLWTRDGGTTIFGKIVR